MDIIFDETGKIRIDKWLSYKFPEKSREFFNNNIKKGNILLNNKKIKPSAIIEVKDVIYMDDEILKESPNMELFANKDIFLEVIFEHKDFLIINKPSGMLTHPTSKNETDTLVNVLLAKYPEIKDVGEDLSRPGIVHRLDKDTSGIIIVARNNNSFEKLKTLFKERTIQKTYTALVYGKLKQKRGLINMPLARSKSKFNKRKVSMDAENSKEALTEYNVVKEYQNYTLVEAMPKTGRMHQIRVHFSALSNFVLGDKEYGSKKINNSVDLSRHFLHASKIEFDFDNDHFVFECPLPPELENFLQNFS